MVSYLERCNWTQGLQGSIVSAGSMPIAGVDNLRVISSPTSGQTQTVLEKTRA